MIDYRLESDQMDKLLPLLITARMSCNGIGFNADNPQFKSGYAKLDAVLDSIVPHLNDNDLYLGFHTFLNDNGVSMLRTRISHACGQFTQSFCAVIPDKDHRNQQQAFSIALTYMMRRQACAVFGIFPTNDPDDNDGNLTDDQKKKAEVASSAKASPYQIKTIREALAITARPNAEKKILETLGIVVLEDMTADSIDNVKVWLTKKVAK